MSISSLIYFSQLKKHIHETYYSTRLENSIRICYATRFRSGYDSRFLRRCFQVQISLGSVIFLIGFSSRFSLKRRVKGFSLELVIKFTSLDKASPTINVCFRVYIQKYLTYEILSRMRASYGKIYD